MTRTLTILVICLFLATLASIAVLLALVTDPPIVFAVVLLLAVFGIVFATLIATNVRRPRGVDPDAPVRDAATDDATRAAILLPDGRAYGRRERDDRSVVDRLSEVLEEEAARREPAAKTPPWAIDVNRLFPDAPEEPE